MSDDSISRQAAIDAVECIVDHHSITPYQTMRAAIDHAKRIISGLPSAQPEIIRCKECKHRPKATRADEKVFYGFSVEFPDEKCPCYCEDGWYGWYPDDNFYCGYAERRTDE